MSSQPRVLLVDYEPRNIRSVSEMLRAAGYTVDVVHDGVAALKAFKSGHPDGVLLEAMLPKKHGFEVCKEIKSLPGGDQIPVVITTGVYRGRKYRNQALHVYKCDEYLERPFGRDQLLEILQRLLPRDELPEEARLLQAEAAPVVPEQASESAPAPPEPPAHEPAPPVPEAAAPDPLDPVESLPDSEEFEMALSETLDGIFDGAPSFVEEAWEAGDDEFIPVTPDDASPAEPSTRAAGGVPPGGGVNLGDLIGESEVDRLFDGLAGETSAVAPSEGPRELVTEEEVSQLFDDLEAAGAEQAEVKEEISFEVDEAFHDAVDAGEAPDAPAAEDLAETMIMDAASLEPGQDKSETIEEELPEGANRLTPSSDTDTDEMDAEVAAFKAETDDPHSWAAEMGDEDAEPAPAEDEQEPEILQAGPAAAEPILPSLESEPPAAEAEPDTPEPVAPAPEEVAEESPAIAEVLGPLPEGLGEAYAEEETHDEMPAGFGSPREEDAAEEEELQSLSEEQGSPPSGAEPEPVELESAEDKLESDAGTSDERGDEVWSEATVESSLPSLEAEPETSRSPEEEGQDSLQVLAGSEEASEAGLSDEEAQVTVVSDSGSLPLASTEAEKDAPLEEEGEAETDPGTEEGSVGLEALAGAEVSDLDVEPEEPVAEDSTQLLDAEELAEGSEASGDVSETEEEIPETGSGLEEARPVPVEAPLEAEADTEAEEETRGSRKVWVMIALAAGLLATVGAGVYFLGVGGSVTTEKRTAGASRQASLGAPLSSLSSPAPASTGAGGTALDPEDAGAEDTDSPSAAAGPETPDDLTPRRAAAPLPAASPEPARREAPTETRRPEPEPEEPQPAVAAEPDPVAAEEPPPRPAAVSLEAELLPEEEGEEREAPMAGLVELPSVPPVEEPAPLPSPGEVEVVDTSAPKAQRGALVEFAELDVPPRAVVTTKPEFPRFAALQGLHGKVFVNVLVTEDGTVAEARAVTGPHKILNRAAVDAIRRWRYTPPVKDGVQVKTWKTEIIVFK